MSDEQDKKSNGTDRGGNGKDRIIRVEGKEIVLGGLKTKLQKASLLTTGKAIRFKQTKYRIELSGLPKTDPDKLAGFTVLKLEFASKPKHEFGQLYMPRQGT